LRLVRETLNRRLSRAWRSISGGGRRPCGHRFKVGGYLNSTCRISFIGSKCPDTYFSQTLQRIARSHGEIAVMREWMYVLSPVLIVVYFVIYPGQFHEFIAWFGRMLN
jgi:hypothetical protein